MRTSVFSVRFGTFTSLALFCAAVAFAQTSAAPPTFYPPPGAYHSRLQVALFDAVGGGPFGVNFYYTTDGSTPVPGRNGAVYTGAITVNASETIKAVAVTANQGSSAASPVSTASYAIDLPNEAPLPRGAWAWESGGNNVSLNLANQCGYGPGSVGLGGNYGTEGVPGVKNTPGSRRDAFRWTDKQGNFWLFGGFGFSGTGACAELNDLWTFNLAKLEWTWMGGSSAPSNFQIGAYGTLGHFAASNMPGSRENGVTWTDAAGNLWLFGGFGYDSSANSGELNDLWEYDVSTHQWAWMAGSKFVNQRGYFRNFGVFHSGNTPGARYGAVTWTDRDGNLWLFGGSGYDALGNYGILSDLWEFNFSKRQWAWLGGSHYEGKYGSYGTRGVPNVYNHPGGRQNLMGWVDKRGNFWLFGGLGYAGWGSGGFLNDLWEFNPRTLQWTWVSGYNGPGTSQGPYWSGQAGVYGILGVPDPGNTPGSRIGASAWTDEHGNLWLFGGNGFDSTGYGGSNSNVMNDLWKFSPNTGLWAWMGGKDTFPYASFTPGIYGQYRVPAQVNSPGARWAASSWSDHSGNLWLFGGEGYDALNPIGQLNDLWEYHVP